jgi:hypothetical protein
VTNCNATPRIRIYDFVEEMGVLHLRHRASRAPGCVSTATINSDLVNVQKIPDSDMEDGY